MSICLFLWATFLQAQSNASLFHNGKFEEVLSRDIPNQNDEDIYFYLWSAAGQTLLSPSTEKKDEFDKHLVTIQPNFDRANKQWKPFLSAERQLLNSLFLYLDGDEIAALWSFRNAYFQYKSILEINPDHYGAHKSMGIIQLALTTVPGDYKWVMDFLGLKATQIEGFTHLEKVPIDHIHYAEAQLFKAFWKSAFLQQHDESIRDLTLLRKVKGNTGLTQFVRFWIFSRSGHAVRLISEFDLHSTLLPSWLLLGEAYLRGGDYNASLRVYSICEKRFNSLLIKSTYNMAVAYHLLGNHAMRDSLNSHYRFRESGVDQYEIFNRSVNDREADLLLKVRLAIDGGYYTRAENILFEYLGNRTEQSITSDEYFYRKARLLHLRGDVLQSIPYYEKVLTFSHNGSYLAPNSCLQLGYIFLPTDKVKARQYFEQALSYKDHPYKRSIDSKAEAGRRASGEY